MPIFSFGVGDQKTNHMTENIPEELCLTGCIREHSGKDGRDMRSDTCRLNWRHPAADGKSIRMSR